jgi:hypothetical protein
MTGKEFMIALANGKSDIIQVLLDILSQTESRYCLIGGLAVNAYVEPVVSLDLDIVAAVENIGPICQAAKDRGLKVETFEHSVNFSAVESDLRIQLQADPRYQGFIAFAQEKKVLGYTMQIARIEDVLQGKVWAYMDQARRKSKRQKDLADIFRIVEKYPNLEMTLPQIIREELKK